MNINRNNYEEYFLDFVEGNLNDKQIKEVKLFLVQNPDLKNELNDFKIVKLIPENLVFPEKEFIKKKSDRDVVEINNSNYHYYFVAKIENDLSEDQIKVLEKYLSDKPDKQKEFEVYQKSILKPEKNLIFFDKDILKKNIVKKSGFRRILPYISAAASLLIIFGIYSSVKKFSDVNVEEDYNTQQEIIIEEETEELTPPVVKTEPEQVNDIIVDNTEISEDKQVEDKTQNRQKPRVAVKKIIKTDTEIINKEDQNLPLIKESIERKSGRNPNPVSIFSPGQRVLAEAEIRETNPVENSEDEYLNIFQYAGNEIKSKIRKGKSPDEKISFWDIADIGLKGYNAISGKDMTLKRYYNNKGKVSNVSLRTESYDMVARLRK